MVRADDPSAGSNTLPISCSWVKTPTASSEGPMSSFDIDVTRDGGWWMVHIPKLGERTQARYPREVELMAREYIAISTGAPIDQVAVNWRRRTL